MSSDFGAKRSKKNAKRWDDAAVCGFLMERGRERGVYSGPTDVGFDLNANLLWALAKCQLNSRSSASEGIAWYRMIYSNDLRVRENE